MRPLKIFDNLQVKRNFIIFANKIEHPMKVIDITLPDFAFLDGANDPTLDQRNVILHVRSASVAKTQAKLNLDLDIFRITLFIIIPYLILWQHLL